MDASVELSPDVVHSAFYNVGSIIGSRLLFRDRNNMTLAHASLRDAHADVVSHIWNVERWPLDKMNDLSVWKKRYAAMKRFKPKVSEMTINVASGIAFRVQTSYMEFYKNMFECMPDCVQKCTMTFSASLEDLHALREAMVLANMNALLHREYHFQFTVSNNTNADIFKDILVTIDGMRKQGAKMKIKCNVYSDDVHDVWHRISEYIGTIDCIWYYHYRTHTTPLDQETKDKLLTVEDFNVLNKGVSIEGLDPEHSAIECATNIVEEVHISPNNVSKRHIEYITRRCKRLRNYVIEYICSDMACIDDGSYLRGFMADFDSSSITRISLYGESLVSPGVVILLRRMLALRRRTDLAIGVLLNSLSTRLQGLCGEMVRRYVPEVPADFDSYPGDVANRKMTHAELLDAIDKCCVVTGSAWHMLAPPV